MRRRDWSSSTFLGLKTLTVIAETEKMILARHGIKVKAEEVAFDDKKAFEALGKGASTGIFQLESTGMRDLLRKMKPDRVEDLIALVALYRPGPMDQIPVYIACKHGREKPFYLHPALEPILADTHGVMTYQEDVMLIARELAGYSLGQADELRRAMGKKIKEEMAKHRVKFIEGAAKQKNIPADIAEQIFVQAEKFAGYGFNKAHAAAYAQVAYQTAWLKANYAVEFFCASMTLDIGSPERLSIFRQEAERMGITVVPPDINVSAVLCSPQASGRTGATWCTTRLPRFAMSVARRWIMSSKCATPAANSRAYSTLRGAWMRSSSTAGFLRTWWRQARSIV